MTKTTKQSGFNIIELLITIGIIGILAGVTLSLVEPDAQNDRANDSVRLANLEKIVQGIEAYNAAEGSYPADDNDNLNPLDDDNGLTTYLRVWPDGEPTGAVYEYSESGDIFGVRVLLNDGSYYKFQTTFNEIRHCTGNIGRQAPHTSGC